MSASPSGFEPQPAPAEGRGDEFARLRELLFGDELRELDEARQRIVELEAAQRELPARLPAAATQALRGPQARERASELLAEPVARALGTAVRTNRAYLVDALFPVIGPVVRRAIAEALRTLVANLNVALESSFTLRGLQWRMQAWRSGVPYAEVVLRHRLMCSIDHVFLIERDSGLVLHHASAPGLPQLDADAIAGMLTALADFVGDSVGEREGSALASAEVGDHVVWMEHGPRANLACFIRGVPPPALRTLLEQRVERIHQRFHEWPDDAPLRATCEQSDVAELLAPAAMLQEIGREQDVAAPRRARWPLLLLFGALLLLAAAWLASRVLWNGRVDALRASLAAHPGFVLTGIEQQPWRRLVVHGLLDPDAAPVQPALDAARLGGVKAELAARGYVASDDAVLERRATRLLQPPPGVRVSASGRVLRLQGSAPQAWIEDAAARAAWVPGATDAVVDVEAPVDAPPPPPPDDRTARAELDAAIARVHAFRFTFDPASADLKSGDRDELEDIVALLHRIVERAAALQADVRLTAIGQADHTGDAELNARLRLQRARILADALARHGIADVGIAAAPEDAPDERAARLQVSVDERLP